MNKKVLLIFSLCLTSCSVFNSSSEESGMTTSLDVFSYYQEKIDELNNIYYLKDNVINKNNYEIEELTLYYWDEYVNLMILLKDKFNNDDVKEYFIYQLGEDKVEDIINFNENDVFYNKKYLSLDLDKYTLKINQIKEYISNQKSYETINVALEEFLVMYQEFIDDLKLIRLLNDLYTNNVYYQNEASRMDSYYPSLDNEYKDIFKMLLESSYKKMIIKDFNLSNDDVSYFLETEIYSLDILSLFEEESNLENQYLYSSSINERKMILLELVKVRKEIAESLNYESYLEYVYKEVYERNYTIQDSLNLIDNIKSNHDLKELYLTYSSKRNNLSNYYVGEKNLLDSLEYVVNIVPNAKEEIKKLKMYGLYNFDYRENKYPGSYKTSVNNEQDFILLNVERNISDYLTLFHEFGHYLASSLEEDKLKGNKFDLDIAEVHSHGLEYLMSYYFDLFLNNDESEILKDNLVFNALWTIYSSSLVSEFEYYLYNTDKLDLNNMQNKFDSLVYEFTYPYSFGVYNREYLFSNISHIYTSPGYYFSYLTSIIPSLQLYSSKDLEFSKKQYNELLKYGTSNDFTYVLDQIDLLSPFEKKSIDKIVSKIKTDG